MKNGVVKKFIDYVRIPSPSESEDVFSKYLAKELKNLGFSPYKDSYGNIYVDIKGTKDIGFAVMLNAHIDTVVHQGKISPRIKDGYIVSDGKTILGADNKAGVAVIMEILSGLKKNKGLYPDIQVIFTVEEEIGLRGAKKLRKDWIYAKEGYVLDGGDMDKIYNKAPFQEDLYVEIYGKAAHAGVRPEAGINAIKVASNAISKMDLGRIDFETTSNIGIISGGVAKNIVPEKVVIRGEARSHNLKKLKKQVDNMKKMIISSCLKNKAKSKIQIDLVYSAFNIGENKNTVTKARKALLSLGIKPKVVLTGGGSDANIFNEFGVESIIIGVGADNVHTNLERIKVAELEKSVDYVLEIIKSYV